MKNLKLTVFALALSVTAAFAQETEKIGDPKMSDEWVVSDFERTELNDGKGDRYYVKQWVITEVYTPVMLDPKDRYKLNQDIIYMPARVNKKVRLDYDSDDSYDKYVEFDYVRPKNSDVNFVVTNEGIWVSNKDSNVRATKITDVTVAMHKDVDKITTQGNYRIVLDNGETVDVKVSNYSRM